MLHGAIHPLTPAAWRDRLLIDWRGLRVPLMMGEPEDVRLSASQALAGAAGVAVTAWYAHSKHFMANNALGLAFCLEVPRVRDEGLRFAGGGQRAEGGRGS